MSSEESIKIEPIGFVRNQAVGDEVKDKSRTSEIVVNPELAQALEGIAGFSHLFVLFWLSEISTEQRKMLKVHPRGRRDLPLLGVFATRTNLRPNPIGLTLVELVNVEGNVLTVRGLDAFNDFQLHRLTRYRFGPGGVDLGPGESDGRRLAVVHPDSQEGPNAFRKCETQLAGTAELAEDRPSCGQYSPVESVRGTFDLQRLDEAGGRRGQRHAVNRLRETSFEVEHR